ncbi:MAG: class I SAM-dependent methyltransferase [Chloroflexi bacterium]|nr:class I SAM-dependent methyltransferase [Chloroflexota bacterium]
MTAAPPLPPWLRLRCPECGEGLACGPAACECARGHRYEVRSGIPHLLRGDLGAPDASYVTWIRDYYRVPFSARQRRLNARLFERFLVLADPRPPVLDVGAGRAEKSAAFPAGQYVGADPIDPVAAGMVDHVPAPLVVARGERLPFGDAQFGSVMLWAVLDHVADRGALVRECARVLRDGGRLCVMTQVIGERGSGLRGLIGWILSRIRTGDLAGMIAVARFTYANPGVRQRLSPLTVDLVRTEVARAFGEVRSELVDGHSLILWATR